LPETHDPNSYGRQRRPFPDGQFHNVPQRRFQTHAHIDFMRPLRY